MSAATRPQSTRLGGAALIVGGSLNFLRNVVNGTSEGFDFTRLPAKTTADAIWAGSLSGWQPSHAMALVSIPLLAFGVVAAYQHLRRDDGPPLALAGTVGMLVSLVLFAVATGIDGFGLPILARHHATVTGAEQEIVAWIALYSHELSCCFGGPAFGGFSMSIGFVAMAAQRAFQSRWFGWLGVAASTVAAVGYLSGVVSIPLGGGLPIILATTHTAYAMLIVLGVWMARSPR